MNILSCWHALQSLLLQIWIKTHSIILYNWEHLNDCVYVHLFRNAFLYLAELSFLYVDQGDCGDCLDGDLHQMLLCYFCYTAQPKVVILGLKKKLVWSSLKGLKKKRLSCYVWKSLDPLWSWAIMTYAWSEPLYIPSFSSTWQSFAELIFLLQVP